MISLATLAVFSGLSFNLLLQFALGATEVVSDKLPKGQTRRQLPLFQFISLFIAVLFLWMVFTYIVPSALKGFSEYFLFFPLSALTCMGLELLWKFFLPASIPFKKMFSAFTGYDGLVPASLIITLTLAGNFSSAVVLVFFFVLGNVAAILALNEIRRRATLEWVPHYLKGTPLIFISMGLLSLISVSVAGLCFRILEVF